MGKAAVDRSDGGLLILDGFPRKPVEAELLFGEIGEPKVVVYLDTTAAGQPDQVSIDRIKQFDTDGDGMLSKEEFAAAGYIGTMLERSEKEGSGATAADMMKKLDAFTEETVPLLDKYQSMGKVKRVDATQGIDEVVAQVGVQLLE